MLRVRVILNNANGGGPYLATHYFTGDDSQTGADNANDTVGDFWNAVDALLDSEITWSTDPEVVELTTAGVQTAAYSVTPATGAGGITTDAMPLASQGLVRWATDTFVGGRRLRGRTFIPGLTNNNNNDGRLNSAAITALNAAAAAMIGGSAPNLSVWSRVGATAAVVTAGSTWNEFAVLRSRRD